MSETAFRHKDAYPRGSPAAPPPRLRNFEIVHDTHEGWLSALRHRFRSQHTKLSFALLNRSKRISASEESVFYMTCVSRTNHPVQESLVRFSRILLVHIAT